MFKVSIKGHPRPQDAAAADRLPSSWRPSFLSSTYIFSDTIQNTFNTLFADAFATPTPTSARPT